LARGAVKLRAVGGGRAILSCSTKIRICSRPRQIRFSKLWFPRSPMWS